jgi:hypothetical protein
MVSETRNSIVPHLTLFPSGKDGAWLVTVGDYDPNDPSAVCTQRRFDTKADAEAFIRLAEKW